MSDGGTQMKGSKWLDPDSFKGKMLLSAFDKLLLGIAFALTVSVWEACTSAHERSVVRIEKFESSIHQEPLAWLEELGKQTRDYIQLLNAVGEMRFTDKEKSKFLAIKNSADSSLRMLNLHMTQYTPTTTKVIADRNGTEHVTKKIELMEELLKDFEQIVNTRPLDYPKGILRHRDDVENAFFGVYVSVLRNIAEREAFIRY